MNLGHRFQGQERQGFFPIGKEKKGLPCNAGDAASIGKIPWRKKWQPTSVFLPGKYHGQRSLAGYSPWDCKRVGQDLVTKQQ